MIAWRIIRRVINLDNINELNLDTTKRLALKTQRELRDLKDEIITVIGFTGLTNPTGVLTWTDDIADFPNFVSNISSQGYTIFSSDLDYVFPYN
jgi:hypothetical protein